MLDYYDFEGLKKVFNAVSTGASSNDLSYMSFILKHLNDIQSDIVFNYNKPVECKLSSNKDLLKIEILIGEQKNLSKEDTEALKELVDIVDSIHDKASEIKKNTKRK